MFLTTPSALQRSLLIPSSRGGVDATSKNIAEGILRIGADGVVRSVFDHPVCASKVASQHFLDAQPPLLWRRGIATSRTISFRFGTTPSTPRFLLLYLFDRIVLDPRIC